jgi:hypothetical protein
MKKSNNPSKSQRERWSKLADLGCIICGSPPSIHHCETGMGRRKDHDRVLPLCYEHHQGSMGIHTLGRKKWESIYGTEQELMDKLPF